MSQLEVDKPLRELTGRAAPYGTWTNRGWYLESFAAGMFDKSIAESARGLPLLMWHNGEQFPIGVAEEWESKPDGLHGLWRLDTDPMAQKAARMAKDGILNFMSVGYMPMLSAWEFTDPDTWNDVDASTLDRLTRLEARLCETSIVTTPAFADAQILSVASANLPGQRHARTTPVLDTWQAWRSTIN